MELRQREARREGELTNIAGASIFAGADYTGGGTFESILYDGQGDQTAEDLQIRAPQFAAGDQDGHHSDL